MAPVSFPDWPFLKEQNYFNNSCLKIEKQPRKSNVSSTNLHCGCFKSFSRGVASSPRGIFTMKLSVVLDMPGEVFRPFTIEQQYFKNQEFHVPIRFRSTIRFAGGENSVAQVEGVRRLIRTVTLQDTLPPFPGGGARPSNRPVPRAPKFSRVKIDLIYPWRRDISGNKKQMLRRILAMLSRGYRSRWRRGTLRLLNRSVFRAEPGRFIKLKATT